MMPPAVGQEGTVRDLLRHSIEGTKPFIAPRRFPGAVRGVIAVLLAASLAGCVLYDIGRIESQRSEDERACASSGYKPDTNQFAKCMQDHDLARMPTTKSGN
jgi:hypothetical protein